MMGVGTEVGSVLVGVAGGGVAVTTTVITAGGTVTGGLVGVAGAPPHATTASRTSNRLKSKNHLFRAMSLLQS
jgi:hypothetical protein